MKFHHIGIACTDINFMNQYLNNLYGVSDILEKIFDERKGAEQCIVILNDGTKIELVSGKIVEGLIKSKNYLYHICYSTPNIDAKVLEFENYGAKILSEPKPTKLFNGKRAAFLLTKLGLIELLEEKESNGI